MTVQNVESNFSYDMIVVNPLMAQYRAVQFPDGDRDVYQLYDFSQGIEPPIQPPVDPEPVDPEPETDEDPLKFEVRTKYEDEWYGGYSFVGELISREEGSPDYTFIASVSDYIETQYGTGVNQTVEF